MNPFRVFAGGIGRMRLLKMGAIGVPRRSSFELTTLSVEMHVNFHFFGDHTTSRVAKSSPDFGGFDEIHRLYQGIYRQAGLP